MKELEMIAKTIQLLFSMPFTHSQTFNGFEASRTTQWHSSPGDVMHSANFRQKGQSTYRP
jgi:hypothetical protein